jgi:hypothetical protein
VTRRQLAAAFLVLASTGFGLARVDAQAPQTPTVDQVLEKYIAGSGGRAALEKVTSVDAKGTIQIADMGIGGTVELIQKAPNKAVTVISLAGVGEQREGFDGTVGWSVDPQNGGREKSGAELAEAKRGAIFGRELKMKEIYPTMAVKGREPINGKDAYVVEATSMDGAPAKLYFDVESGLCVRQVVTRTTPQGPIEVEASFEDFRPVDGVKRPFTVRQVTSMFSAVIQFSEIKQNVAIDDVVFKMPK